MELPALEREYHFAKGRDFRADFALLGLGMLIEIEGGTRSAGRHNRHQGYTDDARKYNLAQMLGWHVYRFTSEQVTSGEATAFMYKAINAKRELMGLQPLDLPDPGVYDGTTTLRQYQRSREQRQV